ncbi:DUF4238 domain-containing protein [Cryobacterium sp. TMT2-4]|uniref:DUF4238 domain-containing protein n=1 Tax=Cryobacterium sp. TMT2-4 TaxID=1259254 RepID=UPI00141A9026|nr:DUF4238 domain-containing protein [Cryobacterium sp. TMT2-4]
MGVKRGHMVSKGYIEAWAVSQNVVDVIDIQDRRGFPSSIRNATVVSYVYDPKVLALDLEKAYSKIEDVGTPVIVKLRKGGQSLTDEERDAMIAFLDMHLDRGRYADQTKLRAPALVLKTGGEIEEAELGLGDVLLLSQSLPEVLRLPTLGLDQWEWKVWPVEGLVTGDGAVLLWGSSSKDAEICTVTFPLSPTRLLVIGRDLPDGVPMNDRIASNSKRWIVGVHGSLKLDWADATDV